MPLTRDELNALGSQILDAAINVHRELGPGLLESVYVFALRKELEFRGIFSQAEVKVPLIYKGMIRENIIRLICLWKMK